MSRNNLVFLSKRIRVAPLLVVGLTGPCTEADLPSEDLSGTVIFLFILCFFDILP